jgi:hypothetical protein
MKHAFRLELKAHATSPQPFRQWPKAYKLLAALSECALHLPLPAAKTELYANIDKMAR